MKKWLQKLSTWGEATVDEELGCEPPAMEILQGMGLSDAQVAGVVAAFDTNHYAFTNPDVTNTGTDLLSHYLLYGSREGRWPTADFSPSAYQLLNRDVFDADIEPFIHFVLSGKEENRLTRIQPSGIRQVPSSEAVDLGAVKSPTPWPKFVRTLAGLELTEAARGLVLTPPSVAPQISVVLPLHNRPELLLECLASLVTAGMDVPLEVIVVDDASDAETKEVLSNVHGITVLSTVSNVGFPAACNLGIAAATGDYVLLLNSDVQLAPDCLSELLVAAERHNASHGIFGPVLLNLDGSIQECGASLGIAGRTLMNGYGKPRDSTVLDSADWTVDYVSGAVALIRRDILNLAGGLDESYLSGYFEDSSLALTVLHELGLKSMVVHKATAVHHLSSSMDLRGKHYKVIQSDSNRLEFVKRWPQDCFKPVRNIAFNLPQFHTIPENDEWWGQGFTEWTNVSRAEPVYSGHVQPRVPTTLGHYNLNDIAVLARQAKLAQEFGVDAFCYYYYSFGGKNPLAGPLDLLIANPDVPIEFCLCWANEPWSRRWDGSNGEVLLPQSMSDDEVLLAAEGLVKYLRDERYVRIGGRPLLLLYRMQLAENPLRTTELIRNTLRRYQVGEVLLGCVESFDLALQPRDPGEFGCDLSVEFPPHGMGVPAASDRVAVFEGKAPLLYEYQSMIDMWRQKPSVPWLRYPGVTPRWDNSPRQSQNPTVFIDSNPSKFRTWLDEAHSRAEALNPPEHHVVFINAWNEWGEGAYLEPDLEFGYGYLEAVRSVRDERLADFNV